jgi:hypothetical protein
MKCVGCGIETDFDRPGGMTPKFCDVGGCVRDTSQGLPCLAFSIENCSSFPVPVLHPPDTKGIAAQDKLTVDEWSPVLREA